MLLAALLRLPWLGSLPNGLSHDETVKGYDAWSVLHTGADQYNHRFPLVFRAIGDQREAILPYLMVASEAVFGPTDFAVRLPTALAGIAFVGLLYLLGYELFGERAGLLAAFFLALSPWHLQVSRLGLRAGLLPVTTTLGLWLFLRALRRVPSFTAETGNRRAHQVNWKSASATVDGDNPAAPHSQPGSRKPVDRTEAISAVRRRTDKLSARAGPPYFWPLLMAGMALGLGFHTYLASRVFVPLLILGLLFIYRRPLIVPPGQETAGAWWRRLVARPAVPLLLGVALLALPLAIWGLRHPADFVGHAAASADTGPWPSRLLGSLHRYAGYFGKRHLLTQGDPYPVPSTGRFGALYWPMLPLLALGLVALLRRRAPGDQLLLCWLLVYPIPASLTVGPNPDWLRAADGMGVMELIAAAGAIAAFDWLRQRASARTSSSWRAPAFAVGVLTLLYAANAGAFLWDYTQRFPDRSAYWFNDGVETAVHRFVALEPGYQRVIIPSDLAAGHDVYLFYSRYDPRRLHREGLEDVAKPGDWADIRGFGDHRVCQPRDCCIRGDLCLVRGDWQGSGTVLDEIHDRNGRVAFTIVAGG